MVVTFNTLSEFGVTAIINYLRKSRQDEELERKTGEDALKAQGDLMDRVLIPIGIPYKQVKELKSGDKIDTRPVFQGVIASLRNGEYQAIAVKEISRMGRGSYKDMGLIYELIKDMRIFIITPYKVYDPKNPADLRQIRFELFLSREEFETTSERLMGGRVSNALAGLWVSGAAPYGFVYNPSTRKLEIKEDEAEVIRAIFDLYVNGVPGKDGKLRDVSFRALATYIKNHTPYRTPMGKREWHPQQLKQLLTKERFIGTMKFRTTQTIDGKVVERPEDEHIIVPNAVPAIVDRDTWDRAQEKIKNTGNKPRTKMDFSPCELASIAVCIKCGRKMVRQYSVQNYTSRVTGEVTQYHKEFLWCTQSGCTFVKYREVEANLLHYLKELVDLDNDLLQELVIATVNKKPTEAISPEEILRQIEQQEETLKNRLDFICEQFELQRYTPEMFDERTAIITNELAQLSEMRTAVLAKERTAPAEVDVTTVKMNVGTLLEAYENCEDKTDKNTILRKIFDKVVIEINQKGRGRIPAKFTIYPILKFDLLSPNYLGLSVNS
ncbi:recombinase family protein [Paenibacillus agilis]|uniref:Recombinase family protein n=1 Tax=Paenibacillus agilis TaxID=3020863 RepID=A0A559IXB7_9BACL|nr:recombinase family protein [Paenibacillus agilis]TVX92275.1 recombinase family protein [Paenibacillus agilis]